MHAVGSTQLPSLTLEIPTPHRIIAIFIDKAAPNVDVNNSGSLGALRKRIARNLTQITGKPLLLSAAIMASMRC